MRTTQGLLAVAAMALALMGFASSAVAATDGIVRDVTNNAIIPNGTELHTLGWVKFNAYICDMTVTIKAKGTEGKTGEVTAFRPLEPFACTYEVPLNGCTLTASSTDNLPWHVTVTPPSGTTAGDLDVTGTEAGTPIRITNTFSGGLCPIAGNSSITAPGGITLKLLKTGTSAVTNTGGRLTAGTTGTAGINDPIAGVELSATGIFDEPGGVETAVPITGELELTSATQRCTWKIAAS